MSASATRVHGGAARGGWQPRRARLFVLVALWLAVPAPEAFAAWVVAPGQEASILTLAEPWHMDTEVVAGVVWDSLAIRQDALVFGLKETAGKHEALTVVVAWDAAVSSRPSLRISSAISPDAPATLRQAAETLRTRLQVRAPDLFQQNAIVWVEPIVRTAHVDQDRKFAATSWQAAWNAVESPPPWILVVAAVVAILLIWRLRRRSPWAMLSLATLLIFSLPLWLVQYFPIRSGADPFAKEHTYLDREFFALSLLLGVVACGWLALCRDGYHALTRPNGPVAHRRIALLATVIGAVSAAVRFGIVPLNYLFDADSGAGRLMTSIPGFHGDHVLLTFALPSQFAGDMTAHMQGIRLVSTLAPPLLAIAAYRLGVSVRGAAFAGLVLAVWPVHAVISASDLLQGPVLAMAALAIVQMRSTHEIQIVLGFLTFGFAIWARPELLLTLAPVAWVALPNLRVPRWRAPLLLGATALAAILLIRWQSMHVFGLLAGHDVSSRAIRTAWPQSFSMDQAELPWFVLLGALASPLGWRRSPGALACAWLGLPIALVVALQRCLTVTELEFVRYGAPAALWLGLLAGIGLDGVLRRMPAGAGRTATAALVVAMLSLPVSMHGYLARKYGSAAEEPLLIAAASHLPPGALLNVPGEGRTDGLDPCNRYRLKLSQAHLHQRIPAVQTVCAEDVLRRGGIADDTPTYWFHGSDCHVPNLPEKDFTKEDLGNCAAIEALLPRTLVWQARADLWNHRWAAMSADPGPPRHQSLVALHLDRVTAVGKARNSR